MKLERHFDPSANGTRVGTQPPQGAQGTMNDVIANYRCSEREKE